MTISLDHGLDQHAVRHWVWDLVSPAQPDSLWDWCIQHPALPSGRTFDPKKARLMKRWYDVIDARLRRRPMAGHPTAHLATEISLTLAAQLYKSTLLNQVMLYALGPQARKCALYMPRDKDLKAVRKGKLRPMLDANEDLQRLLPRGEMERESALAADMWQIGIASLYFQQGCVAADYRREDYELICNDEGDKFPADIEGEGDPRTLQRQRGRTYPNTFLILSGTTPTLYQADGWQSFIKGSCERPIVTMPCCGYVGDLDPAMVVLPEGRKLAEVAIAEIVRSDLGRYACPHCGTVLNDAELRQAMHDAIEQGAWCPGELIRDSKHPQGKWLPHVPRDSEGRQTGPIPPPETIALSCNAPSLWSPEMNLTKFAVAKAVALRGGRKKEISYRNTECGLPSIQTTVVTSVDAITEATEMPYQLGSLPHAVDAVILVFDQQGNTRGKCWYPWVVRGIIRPNSEGERPRSYLLGTGRAMSDAEADMVEEKIWYCGGVPHRAQPVWRDSANGNVQADLYLWAADAIERRMLIRGDQRTPDMWEQMSDDGKRKRRNPRPAGVLEYRMHPHRWRDRLWDAIQRNEERDIDWFLPTDPPATYLASLTSEEQTTELRNVPGIGKVEQVVWVPRKEINDHGDITYRTDNHEWDCEAMMLAIIDICDLNKPALPEPVTPADDGSGDWVGDYGSGDDW